MVVDACLFAPVSANDLRRSSVNAIWVPSILGDGASDEEIERQLLTSGLVSVGKSKEGEGVVDQRCRIL